MVDGLGLECICSWGRRGGRPAGLVAWTGRGMLPISKDAGQVRHPNLPTSLHTAPRRSTSHQGANVKLDKYKDKKVIMVVNVASQCA